MIDAIAGQTISLARLELIEASVPQVENFHSAVGLRSERQALYIRWWDRDGAWGIGECSCRPDPFYSHEFNSSVVELVRSHVLPLLSADGTIKELQETLERVRGWPFAKAALLEAAFDLVRRHNGRDAIDLREVRSHLVPAGISLGIFDNTTDAVGRVTSALKSGYRRIKMKVRPSMDLNPLRAVREAFPEAPLAFDANGSCAVSDILAFLAELATLTPLMVEQPFPPSRLDWCAKARERVPRLRLALDESIEDLGNLEVAFRMGACDEVNIKPGRVGGQIAALELMDRCQEMDLPVWIGGMFETGIGRFANLRLAARIADVTAHDLSPSRRYFNRDVVTDPVDMDADGMITLDSEHPIAIDETVLEQFTTTRWKLRKS
jgi:O-succinylbenzoate synthase